MNTPDLINETTDVLADTLSRVVDEVADTAVDAGESAMALLADGAETALESNRKARLLLLVALATLLAVAAYLLKRSSDSDESSGSERSGEGSAGNGHRPTEQVPDAVS